MKRLFKILRLYMTRKKQNECKHCFEEGMFLIFDTTKNSVNEENVSY